MTGRDRATSTAEKRIKISGTENLGELKIGWPTGWRAGNTGFIGIGTGFSSCGVETPPSRDTAVVSPGGALPKKNFTVA